MKKIVIGNWKMNGLKSDSAVFRSIVKGYTNERAAKAELVLCPPSTLLAHFVALANETQGEHLLLGGQSCHFEPSGSFTGEISAAMLKDAGASLTLIGHAERRTLGEDDEMIARQLRAALNAALTPVLCIGEREEERPQRRQHLEQQLRRALTFLLQDFSQPAPNLLVAYEPVWAIGSGAMPATAEIASVCRAIDEQTRSLVPASTRVSVLYGGSVTPDNAAEILAATDGVLVGSASLASEKLLAIVDAAA